MNAAAIAARLWPHVRRILIQIGRWVLRRIRAVGAQRLAGYMLERIEVFRARRAKAKKLRNARRVRWLTGRISRWLQAGTWLMQHAKQINAKVVSAFEALALGERIPETAPLEKLR